MANARCPYAHARLLLLPPRKVATQDASMGNGCDSRVYMYSSKKAKEDGICKGSAHALSLERRRVASSIAIRTVIQAQLMVTNSKSMKYPDVGDGQKD